MQTSQDPLPSPPRKAGTVVSDVLALLLTLLTLLAPTAGAQPLTSHPRLWLTAADLPRLRSWATDANPVYRDGLARLGATARAEMDAGAVPGPDADNGGNTYTEYPAETYAELFAFLSLVSPGEAERADYAQRARTLLMYVIGKAAQGAAEGQPYRDPEFSTNDRSRWHGEAFALTVDWIYPSLSASDKAAIRTVFLRWIEENRNGAITGHDHPEPIGVVNDPRLVDSPEKLRWALNNYFTAHMRNVGLMAMALDASDDPGGALRGSLANATGAWLYVFDRASRTVGKGGLGPEGFEYFPQTFGFAAQLMLALTTSGNASVETHGPQVSIPGNPFWDEVVQGMLHSLSPAPSYSETEGRSVHLPAWYGSGQHYLAQDMIGLYGPLGILDGHLGNGSRRDASRFIQQQLAPGGAAELARRAYDTSGYFQNSILYFLLFDPSAAPAADPRPQLPLTHFAPGLGRLLARTDWSPSASWFTYKLSFNSVDHQSGDGNQFELYRKGEWLTKERTGYDLEYGGSQNHNTIAILNDEPEHDDPCAYRAINWRQGAQYEYVSTGDPDLKALGTGTDYVYALGDALNLYNSESEGSTDVLEASRSILWLPPDHVVVYDRAASKSANRFKRFWLALPGTATVSGTRTTMTSREGQQLFVSTLLPRDAEILVQPAVIPTDCGFDNGFAASDDPITHQLKVEARGAPLKTRFLHVLQGADGGASPDAAVLLESSAGTPYAGALVQVNAVLFPVALDTPLTTMTCSLPVPAGSVVTRVTGLTPGGRYAVTTRNVSGGHEVTVTASPSGQAADSAGILRFPESATPTTYTSTLVVPIVLSSSGLNGTFFTSELALTNRGGTPAQLTFDYTAAFGGGSGSATAVLPAGRQQIVPDAIEYLRSLNVPLPATGNRGGTLRVTFSGLASPTSGAVTARTTSLVSGGRAGLAYSGIPSTSLLSGPAWLYGLRQNGADRSNIAVLHAGGPTDGNVTLRLRVRPADGGPLATLPDVTLSPGGFSQTSQVLVSNGLALEAGAVRVERVAGNAPYYAYAVVNDQHNGDGSFVPPVREELSSSPSSLTVPVVVEAGSFTSELVVAESAGRARTLDLRFVASGVTTADHTARFSLSLGAHEQRTIPFLVQYLRDRQVSGIGAPGGLSGALFVSAADGAGGLFAGARTSAPGGGGAYGVFTPATPAGQAGHGPVWLYGLQQNAETRTNLALVNTGETDGSADVFRIELFDGATGALAKTIDGTTVGAFGWTQIGTILAAHAPGVSNAYARVSRLSGSNPFLAYLVVNDGGAPGQRTGDGAFVSAQPE